MENKKNQIKVSVPSSTMGLQISTVNTKQVIEATNNRAQYYADLAKKYRDEAKQHRDNAKFYSEQNSDVTVEYIDNLKADLYRKIDTQDLQLEAKFAQELEQKIPKDVSELNNDIPYVPLNDFENMVKKLELPSQTNCEGMFLSTDGVNEYWKPIPVSLAMFDTILKDHILTYEESKGLALQGTYVYKDAIAGSRYGYPDFYAKCLEEYQNAVDLPWTQPVATGETTAIDGGNMVITASNAYSGYDAYKAMDGIDTGTTATTGWGINNTSAVQWWQVKFPYKIRITGITGYQRYDSTPANANTIGQFYTSSDKTTPIGDEYSNAVGVNWNAVSVTGIPAEGIVTDTIYFEKTGGGNYGGLGELKIEATYASLKKNPNGHIFYNIADKDSVDEMFNQYGLGWFYGVDTANERICLPRNLHGKLIKKYNNGTDWYRIYADGWCEQGGNVKTATSGTVTLLKPYINTEYSLIGSWSYPVSNFDTGGFSDALAFSNKTTTTFYYSAVANYYFQWEAKGYIAETIEENKHLYICVGNTTNYEGMTDVVNQGMEILEQVNQGISQGLETRLKLDVSNISQEGKEKIIAWGMPDYSAGMTIKITTTPFIAPCDGIVAGDGNRAGTDNETNIYVNGAFVGKTTNSSQAISINLSKGDALTVGAGTVEGTYFYPMKGVN